MLLLYSDQALRIKTMSSASGSTVSNITYSGNVGTGLRRFGVLIDQSYPSTLCKFKINIILCTYLK
jgi:galacturan 1,4-alpha-galacturonidase